MSNIVFQPQYLLNLIVPSLSVRSEEVFDYSAADMTQEKMRDMKSSLAREIGLIFELCFFVMQNSQVHTEHTGVSKMQSIVRE
jgi:hypothetical protein